MKRSDVGDFTVLYVEPGDQRADLFQIVILQKKPVVIILADQAGVLQRPDDFTLLKHVKRQADLPIIFILPHGTQQAQLAARNGFPVYQSMDALLNTLNLGQIARTRIAHSPNTSGTTNVSHSPRSTKPLFPPHDEQSQPEQRSRRISQHFTPIPQSFTPEEDARQQEIYPDPHRTSLGASLTPTGNPWPDGGINITDRNTGPLVSRKDIETGPTPSPSSENGVTSSSSHLSPAIEFLEPDAEEGQPSQTPTHSVMPAGVGFAFIHHALAQRNKRTHLRKLIILICALAIGVTGSFLVLPHFLNGAAPTPQINGHVVFTSSGQVSETSSQGIEDQLTLDLTNLSAPASGKALYAWLLGDKTENDPQTILLGKLQVNNGTAHLFYPGDAQHTNTLLTMSRVLVTEESTTFTPIAPSPDQSTWRYYSEFSTTPINASDNTKHFSSLDHLRHLLATDPTLEDLELPGGLNNWLYNNTNKTMEWVDSTRQQWEETKDTTFVRRQVERALQFLDGDTFVYQDIPQGTSLLVDERLARIGLINVTGPNQEPLDYLDHISRHLNGLLEANPTSATHQKIAALTTAMGNVNQWLQQVRHDAHQLMTMTDTQMTQPGTLSVINDMIANMDDAYGGQPDPATNTMHEGVNWIHNQMQFLATLDITPYNSSTNKVPVPNNFNQSQPRVLQ